MLDRSRARDAAPGVIRRLLADPTAEGWVEGAGRAARAIAAGPRGPALAALALMSGSLLHGCSTPAAPPATGQTRSALTFPSAAAYVPVVQATGTMGDVTTDAQQDARNIVGDATFPAVFFSNNGSELFVRLRLQENPVGTNGNLKQFGWGLLFNTDGNFDKYEYSLLLDASGNPDTIVYAHNAVAGQLGDPSDTAELVLTTIPIDMVGPDHNVEVIPADSCFDAVANPVCAGATDPDQDYFLSFGVPLSIFSLPATPPPAPMDITQPVQILAGSSSSGQNLSLDLAGCDVSGPNSIPQCQSVPMSLTCGNGVLEGSEGCDDGNGASSDGCNAQCLIEDGLACNDDPGGATGDGSCASGVCDESGGAPGVCEPANACGNGVLDAGEGCDDGGAAAGDGCNAACLIENGLPCNDDAPGQTGDGSCASGVCDESGGGAGVCEAANACGNGVLEPGEGCDDGAAAAGDGCNAACLVEEAGTCNSDPDGMTGADSCASGFCDPTGKCIPGLGVSGGGCSAGPDGAGAAATLLVLLCPWVILALRRRRLAPAGGARRAVALGGLLAAGAVVAGTGDASAQVSSRYSAERFELTGHRDGILGVEWADVRGHLAFDAGIWVGYANDPINVYDMATGDRVGSLVHNRFGGDLVAAIRLQDRFELGLGASLIFSQSQDIDVAMLGSNIGDNGIGDLRLTPKFTVLRRGRTAVAVLAGLGLPTSTVDDYGGDGSVTFSPALAVSHARGGVRLAANAGYRVRPAAQALNLTVDDEVYARIGFGYRFPSSLELDATFDLATGADDMFGAFNRNHAELRGGVARDVSPGVRLFGAVGAGVAEGFGTPDWRALIGVRLAASAERPAPPAPPAPEPPSDRDGDGVLDVADRCPDQAETKNAFEDDDGCPDDPDPDRDHVIGAADACPDQAEDLDGFEDGNGCPDPDNDGDTVLDADDKCRDVAGAPALEGCPDPDRDGDKVVDRLDNCPDEPGLAEHQGCKQKELVKITDGKLEILDIVYFKLDAAVIQPKSYALLDNVARVLNAHPRITKIRVEGHTDDQGNDAYNKRLSQRRADAVRAYLIGKGVDAGRLEAAGFGEEQPKTTNATVEGRATNRRVEFVIVGGSDAVKAP